MNLKIDAFELNEELKQKSFFIGEQLIVLKNKIFSRSSERSPTLQSILAYNESQKDKKKKVQLPSLRYPNATLIERHIELSTLPDCTQCGSQLRDSGMTDDSEQLTVIPGALSGPSKHSGFS